MSRLDRPIPTSPEDLAAIQKQRDEATEYAAGQQREVIEARRAALDGNREAQNTSRSNSGYDDRMNRSESSLQAPQSQPAPVQSSMNNADLNNTSSDSNNPNNDPNFPQS